MTKLTKKSLGCWVDGVRGRYAGEKAQQIAVSYGWTGKLLSADDEFYYEATDKATEYLNSLCDDETCFVWSAGDLLHTTIEDAEGM